jgi:glutathione peroxidase
MALRYHDDMSSRGPRHSRLRFPSSLAPLLAFAALAIVASGCKSQPSSGTGGGAEATRTTGAAQSAQGAMTAKGSLYDLDVHRLDGTPAGLSAYKGKVALLVNVASECGYTPQYAGLEALYEELAPRGFVILGFPSNDFGEQEPGSPAEVAAFAAKTYHVTFPLFEKVKTKGDGVSPVYALASENAGAPAWNFHKYLIDKQGKVLRAFPSKVKPESEELRAAIRAALDAS